MNTKEWEKKKFWDFVMQWSAKHNIWWVDKEDNSQWNVTNNLDAEKELEEYIRSLLSSYTQEIREKVEKLIVNTPDEVARLNSEAGIGNPIAEYAYNQAVGYEKAINDVLQILESNE